ncbi:MAG: sugar ABC transporter substrate-binding protein [Nocardioidaceae bacterium]|nr:sugar ABC transporter substrate-binding protein [Nocardioidaceae bacterium]
MPRILALLTAAVVAMAGLAGCQAKDEMVVAFLVASDQSPRWTSMDGPSFAAYVDASCPDCVYLTANAGGDPGKQASQFADALDKGADVIVLNAVNGDVGEQLVADAGKADVPVVAYDRFVPGADYYVSYDAGAIGRQMAQAVVDRVPAKGSVLLINGAQSDANGIAIKRAVHRVLGDTRIKVVAELDPQTWSAEEAGGWLRNQLSDHPVTRIDAVIAANDLQAGGVVASLTSAAVRRSVWPVITGQDADLDAIRRIVLGQQTLTVFKSFPREAEKAAEVAVALVTGGKVSTDREEDGVPAFVFQPLVVTIDNLTDTIVKDGIYSLEQICQGPTVAACTDLGLR